MSEFKTRAIEDLPPPGQGKPHSLAPAVLAFGELPIGQAMLIPGTGSRLEVLRTSKKAGFKNRYPDRQIHARLDRVANGVWFWWEPK